MSDDIRDQIYKNMDLKETGELLDIWQTNDRSEWADSAFEIIEEILKKRMGNSIPPQDEPILDADDDEEEIIEDEDGEGDDDNLEDWEAKLLDREDQPDFYDTLEVLSLRDNINKVAKAVIVVNLLFVFAYFQTFRGLFLGVFPAAGEIPGILLSFFVSTLAIGINAAVTYFPLKALAHILRILMEMEFNSRKAR